MNKTELIAAIAAKTGETKKDAEATLNAFVNVVSETLAKGDKVQLVGFGSFEVRKRAARKGRNPQTKEEIKIPASKAPVFIILYLFLLERKLNLLSVVKVKLKTQL